VKPNTAKTIEVRPVAAETKGMVTPANGKSTPLSEAIARAQTKPAAVTPPPKGSFTLQLSAAQSRSEADKFADAVKGRGYAPYIVEAKVPGKGTWYRVRLGKFANKDAAQRYLADFRRETQMEAFVASVE
jgi:DedD protein